MARRLAGLILILYPLAILGLGVTTALPGCVASPVTAAHDTAQRAYALYGTFVIVEEQCAGIVADPGTSTQVKDAIRAADARTKPSADALAAALRVFEASNQDAPASAQLQQVLLQAQADIATLVNTLKQGS